MRGCRPLTEQELAHLLQAPTTGLRERALIALGATTGLRIAELLALRVQDLLNTERITIKKKSTKGNRQGRTVKLHPSTIPHLEHLIIAYNLSPTSFLFSKKGTPDRPLSKSQAWRALKQCTATLPGHVATHSLRKTFAQKVYQATGHDIRATQYALGHAEISSTAHYLAVDLDKVDQAVLSIVL
jgi:integrase